MVGRMCIDRASESGRHLVLRLNITNMKCCEYLYNLYRFVFLAVLASVCCKVYDMY